MADDALLELAPGLVAAAMWVAAAGELQFLRSLPGEAVRVVPDQLVVLHILGLHEPGGRHRL